MKDLFLLYEKNKNEVNEEIERLKNKNIKFDVDMMNLPIIKEKLSDIIILKDN